MGADVCRQLLNHQRSSPDAGTLSARNYISHNASLWGPYGACAVSPGRVKRTTAAMSPLARHVQSLLLRVTCSATKPLTGQQDFRDARFSSASPRICRGPGGGGPGSRLKVGGGGKMAELMLLSEIADPTRFFTDNLLSPEDWGARSEAPGEERAAARHGPEARGKAGEGERGRLGGRRAHPRRERAAAGLALPGIRDEGRPWPPVGARGCPGAGERGWTPSAVRLCEWAGGGSGPAEPMRNGAGAGVRRS